MSSKAELLAAVARSRAAIRRDSSAVRTELDVAAKLQNSVRSRPLAWLGGAAAIGYLLAGPKTRTKTVTKLVREKSGDPVRETKKSRAAFLACSCRFSSWPSRLSAPRSAPTRQKGLAISRRSWRSR